MSSVDEIVTAIDAGGLVVIPTDTVYGLACRPDREEAVRALSALKRRSPEQPIALVAASVAALRELIPELSAHHVIAGPYTLVLLESGAATPLVGWRAARHHRRARSRALRPCSCRSRAGRRRGCDEREPPRWP